MRQHLARALAFALLPLCTHGGPQTAEWTGRWQGGLRSDTQWCAARADLRERDGRIEGELSVPALGIEAAPLEVRAAGEALELAFDVPELGRLDLAARLEDGALRSTSGATWDAPALQLFRPSPLGAADLDACSGWYELAPGERILVARGSDDGLRFFNGDSSGTLIPSAPDRFRVAYNDGRPAAPRVDLRFVRTAAGAVEGLAFDDGEEETSARRLNDGEPAVEAVALRNGALELHGLYLHPKATRPHAAVVFVGGTGYSTADRSYEMMLAERLLGRGLAVLLLDKRGCGASGGDWRTSTLAELAGDSLAAVRWLRARKEIERDAVGLWGVSEGGWIAAAAAAQSTDVAFIVNQGGPAVSPLEDELDDLEAGIGELGFPDEQRAIALELARALVDFYGSAEAAPRFEAALEAARRSPWWEAFQARIPQREDDWRVQWWRKRAQLDSPATWKSLRLPALVLIGSEDDTMHREKNLRQFEALCASNPRLEIRVIPGADHGLRTGGALVPGVVEQAAEWISKARRP